MQTWLPWTVALVVACGDNLYPETHPVVAATDLTIVAHQDDDLLFMQPDLYDAVRRKTGLTNVYVTAGNGAGGIDRAEKRYGALMAAYGAIAGSNDWSCGWARIRSNEIEHCRLDDAKLSLIFLAYPDGGVPGHLRDSLLQLWEGTTRTAPAVAYGDVVYDRPTLIRVVADIIGDTQPRTLRTLDIASTHGHDHSDHMIAGALALLATAYSSVDPEVISYRGYNINGEPPNANPELYERSLVAVAHYEACAVDCGPCGAACPSERIDPLHLDYLRRRYAIGVRQGAAGKLRIDDRCVTAVAPGFPASFIDCSVAPTWHLDRHGNLTSDTGLCLEVFGSELLATTGCEDPEIGPRGRFFYDDEGHLWSGVPPHHQPGLAKAHLLCAAPDQGRPRPMLCGEGHAPRWEFVRPMTSTPRGTAAITRTGRAVRMARVAGGEPMLCSVEPGDLGLMCAPSTRDGALLPAARVDSASEPLAIAPDSLVLGDVDSDGLTDACGRAATGLVCATAADRHRAQAWSPWPGSSTPVRAADASLAITRRGQICGLADDGVVCVSAEQPAPDARSTWPDPAAALWIADLDGDGDPDWCTATDDGPACSLAADRKLTTDGAPWSFAFGMVVEASASDGELPNTATTVVTDADGDGRDDLCTARAGAIVCARSLGRGFAPRLAIARLPDDMVPDALWAEPARPSGVPRLCAADATTIACTSD